MSKLKLFAAALAIATSAHVAEAKEVVVRIGFVTSQLSPYYFQSKKFADEVKKRLPGQFDFKLFPNGQLGSETTLVENLQLGTLEMASVSTGAINIDPQLGFFDLPWLFKDRAQVQRAMKGPLWAKVAKVVDTKGNVKTLGIYENAFRDVMSRRLIKTPADMKGLKIRLSGGKTRQAVFKALGANPTPINWAEVFTALQTGVVDGAEAGIYGLYEAKLYQILPNLSLTRHVFAPSFLLISPTFWGQLTPEQQKVFVAVAKDITEWTYQSAAANEEKYLKLIKAHAKVNEIDFPSFREQVKPVYDAYVKKHGDDWLKDVEAAAK